MSKHIVAGAGPIGSAVARQLAAAGESVVVVTRSGSGPDDPNVTKIAADAADAAKLSSIAYGAVAIYNCANPPYTSWPTDWPPIAAALLEAAHKSGAVLATCSNLYGYGPVDGPISPDLPLAATGTKGRVRATMWEQALAAHQRGDARVTEVRGSDYVGPGVNSHLGERVVPRLLAGKGVSVVGSPDQPHSWTFTDDMARALVATAAAPQAWGRAWHAPTNPARTAREAIADMADIADVPMVKVKGMSKSMLSAVGLFSPMVRELKETYYQFNAPFVIDDSATRSELGLEPTPWNQVLVAHLEPFGPPAKQTPRQR
ncbi:MAG: NAD-dependent epimerase/dehydratase family protein [Actinomycetes bacterium]